MDGCLTNFIKLAILGLLFCVGLVFGYAYNQGFFDAVLIEHAFTQVRGISVDEATRRVVPAATPALAVQDFKQVDQKFVTWKGRLVDSRTLSPSFLALVVQTSDDPRRQVMVFLEGTLEKVGVHLGDPVEVTGQARSLWVVSEDRDGRRLPQVLALAVRRLAPSSQAVEQAVRDITGRPSGATGDPPR